MNPHASEIQAARANVLKRRWFLRDCGIGLAGIAANAAGGAESFAAMEAAASKALA